MVRDTQLYKGHIGYGSFVYVSDLNCKILHEQNMEMVLLELLSHEVSIWHVPPYVCTYIEVTTNKYREYL